jgi:hypothetical protein
VAIALAGEDDLVVGRVDPNRVALRVLPGQDAPRERVLDETLDRASLGGVSAPFAASGFSGSGGFAGGSWRSKTTRSAVSSQRALA